MRMIAENVSRTFFRKTGEANYFFAVHPVTLELDEGSVTVLTGRSGSGKTTLLNLLSGLLPPTEGRVLLGDTDLYALPDSTLSLLRSEKIGVVPQGRSAVDTRTVRENILLPALLYGKKPPEEEADRWMEELGIASLRDARPKELSGGELRRMAIARALSAGPEVLFADEPTGDLDDVNTARVLEIFRAFAHEKNKAVFIVTHDSEAVKIADRTLRMDAGTVL